VVFYLYIKKGRTKEVYTGMETAKKGKEKISYLKVLTISKKKGFFGAGKSMSLKGGLLKEPLFPAEKGVSSMIEDSIIPLFLN
jgi:hypothetical protein